MLQKLIAIFLFILLLSGLSLNSRAQIHLGDKTRHLNKSSVYLELGGSGYVYSVNYEHLFFRNQKSLGIFGRLGLEYLPVKRADRILHFPVAVNMVVGNKNSKFELGAGGMFRIELFPGNPGGEGYYLTEPPTRIFFTPNVGYRFYSKKNEYGETLLVRANFYPMFGFDVFSETPFFFPWFGVSIGKTWTQIGRSK